MRHLQRLGEDLIEWGRHEPRVRAILWYGSMARGDTSAHSDLDAAVVLREGTDTTDIVRSFPGHFGHRVRACSHIESRGEATLWVDETMTKVDLQLVCAPESLAWLADSPDITPPRLVVALDKEEICGVLVDRAAKTVVRDVKRVAVEEIEKFLVAFEACSSAHRRSDGYQFYFQYNLALHRLARLVELSRGEPEFLYLPKLLLPRRMSLPEQIRWRELRGTIYLPEANEAKRRLAAAFMQTVVELGGRVPIRRTSDDLRRFLEAIILRDLFFNVRDFADAYEGAVRRGRLFRTSTLTRWQQEPLLRQWLADRNVRTIIDFRNPVELAEEKARYPEELLTNIRYLSLPLSGPPRPEATPRPKDAGRAYERLFFAQAANVVEAMRAIADNSEGGTVVHCHVGKDRTGWFCAALGLLLGLSEEHVIHDYMLSGQGVEASAIQYFIQAVRNAGGVRLTLEQAGLSDAERQRLSEVLLTPENGL